MKVFQRNLAILHHPQLRTMRAVGSFRPDERDLFEAQFACWSMRCIYTNGDRYLLENEYAHFSVYDSDDWDEPAVNANYASQALSSHDLLRAAQEETEALDRFALSEKSALERCVSKMLTDDLTEHFFIRATRISTVWDAAAVAASHFGTSAQFRALSLAITRLENTLFRCSNHENDLAEFHRELLKMASTHAADDFNKFWPLCRVDLHASVDTAQLLSVLRRLRDTIGGFRGNPYGSDNPALAMSDYLSLCTFT